MITITKIYTFNAAHRVEGDPRCGKLHGHNYTVTVAVDLREDSGQPTLDAFHMDEVVKSVIKPFSGKYIVSAENISAKDPYADIALARDEACILGMFTSTINHLAEYFAFRIHELLLGDVVVTVSDDDTSSVTYWYGGSV